MNKQNDSIKVEERENKVTIRLGGTITGGGYGGEDYISANKVYQAIKEAGTKDIDLYVNSPGGDVFASIEIYNLLKKHQGHVKTYITGRAYSGASLFVLGSDEVEMMLGSKYMAHNPWTITVGNAEDLRDVANQLDEVTESMIDIYMKHFKGTREELIQSLEEEKVYSAKEAFEAGLATAYEETSSTEQTNSAETREIPIAALDMNQLTEQIAAMVTEKLSAEKITEPTQGNIEQPTNQANQSLIHRFKKTTNTKGENNA